MRKSVIKYYLIMFLVCAVVAVALAEIYFRVISPTEYYTAENLMTNHAIEYEDAIFARSAIIQKKKDVVPFKPDRTLSSIRYHINSQGYRGREFTVEKPDSVTRIIVYGGSQVFGTAANEPNDWPHLMEAYLKSKGYNTVEVINAGVPGHASFDSVGRLFSEGHRYSPDIVILDNAWNDIKYFKEKKPLFRVFKPAKPWLDPRLYYRFPGDRYLSEHLQVYGRIRNNLMNWYVGGGLEARQAASGQETKRSTDNAIDLKGINGAGAGGIFIPVSEYALSQFKLNVQSFVDLAKNIHAIPVLMTQPRLVSRENTPDQKKRIVYDFVGLDHNATIWSFEKTDAIYRKVAKQKSSTLIDVSSILTGIDEYFVDHVHLSKSGNEATARFVGDEIIHILTKLGLPVDTGSGSSEFRPRQKSTINAAADDSVSSQDQ